MKPRFEHFEYEAFADIGEWFVMQIKGNDAACRDVFSQVVKRYMPPNKPNPVMHKALTDVLLGHIQDEWS